MDLLIVTLSALAKAMATEAGKGLAAAPRRAWQGRAAQSALMKALQRSFDATRAAHADRIAAFDVNPDFLVHEGAAELAKAIIPGTQPSHTTLARLAVDSLGGNFSDDDRFDYIDRLRPAFKTLLETLVYEVRQEPGLKELVASGDQAVVADAAGRLVVRLGAAAAGDDDLTVYLRWVIDQHSYVRAAGIVRRTTVQLPLDKIFVGLSARPDQHPGDRARDWFAQEHAKLLEQRDADLLDDAAFEAALDRLTLQYGHKTNIADHAPRDEPVPVLDSVRTIRHLLVLGEPGAGKTTLLRYLALTHARALATGDMLDGREPLFPIYLRIGDFARSPRQPLGIGEHLDHDLRQRECHTPGLPDLIRQHLDRGSCLVLIDGLDEVASPERRHAVVAAVSDFVTTHAHAGNRFVVTSRISGYLAAPLPTPFRGVRLLDMDSATIDGFLDVYCRHVEQVETPDKTAAAITETARQEAAAIRQALTDSPGVRRLATNPLLLTALVLVHRASGRLPHRRVEAYVEVCNALGRTWRTVQGVAEADLPDERVLTRWLTALGAWLHEHRPEGSATVREILSVLGPHWADLHGATWNPAALDTTDIADSTAGRGVADFLDKADRHTGLLVERAPGRYGFAHLTFEEYYAARALAYPATTTDDRIATVRQRIHNPRYEEPILLAIGLIGSDQPEQVTHLVTEAIYPATELGPSPHEDILGRDFLFALRILADDIPVATATIDIIVNQALDEYLNRHTSRCRFRAWRTTLISHLLNLRGTSSAQRLLHALNNHAQHASHANPDLFCELLGDLATLKPLPDAAMAAVVALATTADDLSVRVSAVGALARVAAPLPAEVVAAAVTLATTADASSVRVRAVEALAQAATTSEAAMAAVVTLATTAIDSSVRVSAVGALVRVAAPLSAEVVAAAVTLATIADDPNVQVNAVEALARAARTSEAAMAAVVTLATTVNDLYVRVRAVEALARAATTSEAAMAAVVALATTADDLSVRVSAVGALARVAAPLPAEVVAAAVTLATTAIDPSVRVSAVGALVRVAAPLSAEVVAAAVTLATTAIASSVRVSAVGALVRVAAPLSAEVVAAAVTLATTADDSYVRVSAVAALAQVAAPLPAEVVAAAVTLATTADASSVRVRAVEALAQAATTSEAAMAAVVTLATTAIDSSVRVSAVGALVRVAAPLSAEVVAAAVTLATTAIASSVRVSAVGALVRVAAPLSAEVVAAAVTLATTADASYVRESAVAALAQAATTSEEVVAAAVTVLISQFADDSGAHREAVAAIAALVRRRPETARNIQAALVDVCRCGLSRNGASYAFEAFSALVKDPYAANAGHKRRMPKQGEL